MKALAKIHVAKKQLDMDEDAYRDMLQRTVGQRTSKGLSDAQCGKVLEEFRRLGFVDRRKLEGKYAAKLQALWIAAWNLGVVPSERDEALIGFVHRQTQIDHARFVHYHDDAMAVIEALKARMTRVAGVDWVGRRKPDGQRIAEAQYALLALPGSFRDCVLDMTGKAFVHDIDGAGWIKVMNALGEKIRAMKGAA